jgi:hypothetical protein
MVRLRNAAMAVVLGTGVMGCSFSHHPIAHYSIWHCDECDDFPTPAYGPGFSMMPGTYTGPPGRESAESSRPANASPSPTTTPSAGQPGASTTPTPPAPPVAAPEEGADARQGAAGRTSGPSTVVTGAESALPPLPSDLPVPVAHPGS